LADLIAYLDDSQELEVFTTAVRNYQERYGI
jgi:hypothetical protein